MIDLPSLLSIELFFIMLLSIYQKKQKQVEKHLLTLIANFHLHRGFSVTYTKQQQIIHNPIHIMVIYQ